MQSFSKTVKEDIVFNDFDVYCEKALLSALIKILGTLSITHNGILITIKTENAKVASKTHKILKSLYQPHIDFMVSRKMKLNKNNTYILKINKAREIIDDLHLMDGLINKPFPDKSILVNDDTIRAYLCGVFLGCGSVNDPKTSNYHLEMSVNEEDYANFIKDLMNQYGLNAKVIKRRNKYVVYLKSAEKIGDFLRAIGASQSVMNYEVIRINRSMTNTVNRMNNCDIANEMKAMSASQKQIDDIVYIKDKVGLDILDDKTREVALLRLENPELTLNELAQVYYDENGRSISKSGLHHRFAKIKEEAARIKTMEGK